MLKGLVLVTVCASLLLVGMISSQSFAASGHLYISQWKGFDTTEPDIDCLLWAEYCHTMHEGWKQPQQIAVDDERNIYVADTNNSRIQKFTSDGEFLSSWGTYGVNDGEFQSPVGIAIYENNIYVVDDKLNIIQKFDNDGNLFLIDEVLTPDSSRFWSIEEYEVGISPPSFDKQYLRDYLETLDWDKTAPGPELPEDVIANTTEKYRSAYRTITQGEG